MGSNYTDQDTARARQAESSSAGAPTQLLGNAWQAAPFQPVSAGGRNNLVALLLIAVGIVLLLGRAMPNSGEMTGGMVLLTMSSCFLFFALWKRIYGLLIPGCILGGLSIGVTFAGVTHGVSVLWGLSLGFLAILLLGRALFRVHNHWPVYPSVVLFGVGIITAASQLPAFFLGGLIWLPLLLIVAGLYLGWRRATY